MFNLSDYSINGFLVLLVIIVALAAFYYTYLRTKLFDRVANNQTIILIIERALFILGSITIIYAFIILHPVVNGIIIAITLFFARDIISNILHGILLIRELSLRVGKTISVGNETGIISQLSYTGLQLTNGSNTEFISYERAYRNGVKEEDTENATLVSLLCDIPEGMRANQVMQELEARLFSMPFILHHYKPSLDVINDKIKIQVGIENISLKNSLIDALEFNNIIVRSI